MKRLFLLITIALFSLEVSLAQENFPYNGVKDKREKAYAFTNATIHVDYQSTLDSATLLIKDGVVMNAGKGLRIPKGYTVVECSGKHIYPSFIDLNSAYGFSKAKLNVKGVASQVTPLTPGAYNPNDAINSYVSVSEHFKINKKQAAEYRKYGFGTVLSANQDGIARGSSALVLLQDQKDNKAILKAKAGAHYSFSKGSSKQSFPSSTMGSVALLRQTYMDAEWYGQGQEFTDVSLDAWMGTQNLPQFFYAGNKHGIVRADMLGDEFGKQFIIVSGGDEYQNIQNIKETKATLIVPLNFPKAYNVDDPLEALDVSLKQMKHWELASHNPRILAENNIEFSITSSGLQSRKEFLTNLRRAVTVGLSKEDALKALSYTPARLVNVAGKLGQLKTNYLANFIISDKDVFEEKAQILENWVKGDRYEVSQEKQELESGTYTLQIDTAAFTLEAKNSKMTLMVNDSTKKPVSHTLEENLISLNFDKPKSKENIRLSGWKSEDKWMGKGEIGSSGLLDWSMSLEPEVKETAKDSVAQKSMEKDSIDVKDVIGDILFPFSAYGQPTPPKSETILIKNITVWTNDSDRILRNTDVLIEDGKIKKIGKGLSKSGTREVDGTGKHLTPGIIDEHSHIALFSVNDVATNSGMVRMKDVINSEDINIYRQLAGGVTSSQLLHGSANPIGGQSAIVKLKWGYNADEMLIDDADAYIKFALGENVKQSNWGDANKTRFPQTRMGVEQVYMDAFTNALEYEKEWQAYNKLSSKDKGNAETPRRDLVKEAMLEIVRKKRFITCHSYVQSEINMLMKVAEKFDFNINTFTHILEGYKVADKMKAHGVGGSTFADWWAYKWEVRYAIPYNAALMHKEGVTVAINSDDSEMGRRLNQEAAKSIKYGDMSEEDALKMVTLNPAKLLHLDDRMGSIKVGKDADVVIWSDNPLSIYAKVEKTIIEGAIYFDLEKDRELRDYSVKERARLIAKMKEEKAKGKPTQDAPKVKAYDFHCDNMEVQF
ncbi:MAG: amidohydrolase family protein [Cyclobacteriaceae bacterium]